MRWAACKPHQSGGVQPICPRGQRRYPGGSSGCSPGRKALSLDAADSIASVRQRGHFLLAEWRGREGWQEAERSSRQFDRKVMCNTAWRVARLHVSESRLAPRAAQLKRDGLGVASTALQPARWSSASLAAPRPTGFETPLTCGMQPRVRAREEAAEREGARTAADFRGPVAVGDGEQHGAHATALRPPAPAGEVADPPSPAARWWSYARASRSLGISASARGRIPDAAGGAASEKSRRDAARSPAAARRRAVPHRRSGRSCKGIIASTCKSAAIRF